MINLLTRGCFGTDVLTHSYIRCTKVVKQRGGIFLHCEFFFALRVVTNIVANLVQRKRLEVAPWTRTARFYSPFRRQKVEPLGYTVEAAWLYFPAALAIAVALSVVKVFRSMSQPRSYTGKPR